MSSDEDEARLLAALSLALRRAALDESKDTSFETKLARLGDAMVGRRWQVTAARDLKLSIWSWLARPWHCWKLRQLVRVLLHEELHPKQEADAINLLNRCAAMVEFGVDVNDSWYRRLRGLVAAGKASNRELRSLLGRSTVWWGTEPSTGDSERAARSLARRLWAMGRPANGELLIADHHWTTRLLLLLLLGLAWFALAVVAIGFVRHLLNRGAVSELAPMIVAFYTYGVLVWAAWWFGPHSWSAADRLRDLLDLGTPK
jgi:hypothetical protein